MSHRFNNNNNIVVFITAFCYRWQYSVGEKVFTCRHRRLHPLAAYLQTPSEFDDERVVTRGRFFLIIFPDHYRTFGSRFCFVFPLRNIMSRVSLGNRLEFVLCKCAAVLDVADRLCFYLLFAPLAKRTSLYDRNLCVVRQF